MPDIEIKRGYEVLSDNNVRFGIRVINNSEFIISDVEVILDYNESLFELSGNKIHKLSTIPPTVPRTAKFMLKPLGCIHKENIGATIIYKDHQWKKHTIEMNPKEVHCVCPFLKEKSIKRSEFLNLSKSGFFEERGVNFEGITVEKLVEFISHTCKNRLYKVDEFPIENGKIIYLAGDALGEKAYYLLTAVVKEYEGLAQVLLRANSDKNYGLNGFLNEILDNLRHLVISASAREIGIIRKEQVINIIDSVVQRSSFSVGEGAPSVNVLDSVVQGAQIKDEEKKKREEERLRKEREEQERLRSEAEEIEKQRHEEKERKRKAQEVEERGRKTSEERERQRKLEAEKKEKELQEQRAEEERQRRQNEEIARIQREKEDERHMLEKETKSSGGKWFFAVIIIFVILALGYWTLVPSMSDTLQPLESTPSTTPKTTAATIQNPKVNPNSASKLSNDGGKSWQYYKDVSISNTGGALKDYQVRVSLSGSSFPAKARSNGEDIRFTDANGNELGYWIESWDNTGKSAKIWVKLTGIPVGATTIRIYYGNPSAASSSNGTNTFLLYDHFEGNSLNTNIWSQTKADVSVANSILTFKSSPNYGWIKSISGYNDGIVTYYAKLTLPPQSHLQFIGFGKGWEGSNSVTGFYPNSNRNNVFASYNGKYISPSGADSSYTIGSYSRYTTKWSNTGSRYFQDDTEVLGSPIVSSNPEGLLNVLMTVDAYPLYIDYVYLRKYASPEPALTLDDEQPVPS